MGGVSWVGLFTPDFYTLESINWQAQSTGQDILDLFLVSPALLICAAMAYRGSRPAKFTWAGVNLYLVYTFIIYAFDIHFNSLFYFYCLCLGLSFYSIVYFLYTETQRPETENADPVFIERIIGVYFIVTAILFYILWISDIMTAILYHTLPASLTLAGLPTNPVHVLDLAIVLPALCLTGVLLLRQHRMGRLLAPVILVFTLLMNLTIGGLNLVMHFRDLEMSWTVTIAMFVLAAFNFLLLLSYWKTLHTNQSRLHAT